MSVPGIAWVLGYTIASEIGDINRFATPRKLFGYTGLCPRVYQSGETDRRGALSKHGPDYLRWALIEAAHTAARIRSYRELATSAPARQGRQRGAAVAPVDIARKPRRGDLVDAHPQPALRSGRRHACSGRSTVPDWIAPPERLQSNLIRPPGGDRGMSHSSQPTTHRARDHRPARRLTTRPPS